MGYKITLKKRAMKALEKINEPFYSKIKIAIISLANDPHPVIDIGHRKDIYQ